MLIVSFRIFLGLFLNDFEDSTDPEFGGALETDSNDAIGGSITVNFVNELKILGVQTNTLTVGSCHLIFCNLTGTKFAYIQ